MWDFRIDDDFQTQLDWIKDFVKEECEPLDVLFPHGGDPYDVTNKAARRILKPLQKQVKDRGLWACHLGPELGGKGFGQVKLALMNEVLGRSQWAPTVFGTAAPDTGNAEILAMFGTADQKSRYLQPLLDGDIVSCFSMTEPTGGADPGQFTCRAVRDGDDWVINGEKWFSSNARWASFLLVLAVTDPEARTSDRMSMFIVPTDTPGIEIIRNVGVLNERDELDEGAHAYIRYSDVRVRADSLLGEPGGGFRVAQARLGGGRVHHAMRTVGKCQRALDMMCERALSRKTKGERLADKQFVQDMISLSRLQLEQFRLLVMKTAWIIDNEPHGAARDWIAMTKVVTPQIQLDIIRRAVHIHGSLGATHETPLGAWWSALPQLALADGPTEVHKVTVAKGTLRGYDAAPGLFPTEHLLPKRAAARARYADILTEYDL
jgi:acyl-CoA dehydrogenase